MIDLIVFSVGTNKYALDIENIQRIIQAEELTNIPNTHKYVDGMMSYEDKVIKVLSFRKLIGLESYDDELRVLFATLKKAHKEWIESLGTSVSTGSAFTKTTNPHLCDLGKWIDAFNSYDDTVSDIFSELVEYHKQLHVKGGDIIETLETDKTEAQKMYDIDLRNIYDHTMHALDTFVLKLDIVANSLQKLIIYENENATFAIKVDVIEDIAHIQEEQIMHSSEKESKVNLLELDGVLDLDSTLINIIKTVKIPD